MAQFGRPNADVSNTGWTPSTGATLYGCIDETSASDSDYIRTTGVNTCEISLSTVTDPGSSSNHVLRIRAKATGSGAGEKWTVILMQGASTIKTCVNAGSISRSWTDLSFTLSSGEADSITDYSVLKVQMYPTTIGSSETIDVSFMEFEVPDYVGATYNESVSLGKSQATSLANAMVMGVSLSIGKSNEVSDAGGIYSQDSVSLGRLSSIVEAGGLSFQDNVSLGKSNLVSDSANLNLDLATSLSNTLQVSVSPQVIYQTALTLARNILISASTPIYTTYDEPLSLSKLIGVDQSYSLILEEQILQAKQLGLVILNQLSLSEALMLYINRDIQCNQNASLEFNLTLGNYKSITTVGGLSYGEAIHLATLIAVMLEDTISATPITLPIQIKIIHPEIRTMTLEIGKVKIKTDQDSVKLAETDIKVTL